MAYNPNNPNGQTTMANSAPVVIASNQSAVPVSGTVSIGSTPVAVSITGTPVAITGSVSITGTPVVVSGSVSITGTPIAVTVGSTPLAVSITGTPIAVNATLSAETTKVIGTVNIGGTPIAINLNQVAGGTAINSGVTGAVAAGGDTASGSSDAGNPIKIGGVGRTTNPTAVTDGQRANAIFDKLGKQVVVGSIRDLKINQRTIITSSTAETTVLTAVASTFLDVYGVVVINSSATATNMTFKDSTSGTAQFDIYVPAGDTRGFMLPESAAVKQTTVNNNWTATSSASVASVNVAMLAVKNT